LLPALLALAGCSHTRSDVEKQLMADRGQSDRNVGVAENYLIGCPDVIEIAVARRPDLTLRAPVGPDGRADLGELGQPRVEGHTPAQIAQVVAEESGLPTGQVSTRVIEYNSQEVYVFGEVAGVHRAVPYQGQETVLDLLQRAGGITPGAAPEEVFVVRPHLTDGTRPEVFHVDLHAIVLKNDPHTNLRLQPFDQIHVGETRQAKVERCIPPWLRPLYQALCGTRPAADLPSPRGGEGSGVRGDGASAKR
jgi:protein involved in polysaccharide export with SLBB domain